jgi:hypothetical protein
MRVVNIIKQRGYFLLLMVFLSSLILLCSQVQASMNNTNSPVEFLDNGRLTLNAKGVPLGTLLGKIQEKTNLEFQIPENLLKQPIFATFQSLSLKDVIRRILHGLSYACIFDSNGNVEKIITFTNSSKDKESSFPRSTQDGDLPFKVVEEIMPPSEAENIEEAMGIEPPSEMENIEETMEIVLPPEVDDMEDAMGFQPPPKVDDIEDAMGIESSGKKESP